MHSIRKNLRANSEKKSKNLILGHFGPVLPKFGQTGFFPKNRAPSLFSVYESLTSYRKSEKTLEPIPRKTGD
jgi:hypothetical protein